MSSTRAKAARSSDDEFGPVHVVHPRGRHTHTIILLHGRGSTGEEFCEELMVTRASDGRNLGQALPGFRMVFPTAPMVWSRTFQEYTPAWLETFFLANNLNADYATADGIITAVPYLMGLIEAEAELLGGRPDRVVLGGISEGGSVGMWTLLCLKLVEGQRLGGFIGINTTLPFAPSIQRVVRDYQRGTEMTHETRRTSRQREQDVFVRGMLDSIAGELGDGSPLPLVETPVLLYHGTDNVLVDAELGREAFDTFNVMGFFPKWCEYSGGYEMGHWIKEPEGIDDIRTFLRQYVMGRPDKEGPRAAMKGDKDVPEGGKAKKCRNPLGEKTD